MQNSSQPSAQPSAALPPPEDRRFFVKAAALVIGALITVFPFAVGLKVFFDPLRRQRKDAGMIRVAALDAIPDDEVPRLFSIVAERVDAWNRFPKEPIGAVYLLRKKGQQTPTAFTATCPHLGCFIGYDGAQRDFRCPCHTSAFALDGQVIMGPSPRPMDTLPCEVKDGDVLVTFETFQTGTPDKILKS
jgi:menaquinol-cytochrome c reductase iron-sulfur subunit